jgi:hypothetical protein
MESVAATDIENALARPGINPFKDRLAFLETTEVPVSQLVVDEVDRAARNEVPSEIDTYNCCFE